MVLIGWISRSRGQKMVFKLQFSKNLVWNYKAQSFQIWCIASSRSSLPIFGYNNIMASPWHLTFSSGERPRALWALLFNYFTQRQSLSFMIIPITNATRMISLNKKHHTMLNTLHEINIEHYPCIPIVLTLKSVTFTSDNKHVCKLSYCMEDILFTRKSCQKLLFIT